jgi:hypothetical protein
MEMLTSTQVAATCDFLSVYVQSLAIDKAHSITGIQLIVLILEGIFVGVLSLGYMWLMGAQVMWQRYRMFNGEGGAGST